MYRQTPSACVSCGAVVEPREADVTESGPRCWRCTTRGDIERLHEDVRQRVPTWRQLVARGAVSTFAMVSFVAIAWLGSARQGLLLASFDCVLVAVAMYGLARGGRRAGVVLATVQCWFLAAAGFISGTSLCYDVIVFAMPLFFVLGYRALPIYPPSPSR